MKLLLALALTVAASAQNQTCPAPRDLDKTVDNLIARMTVEERIAQLQDRAPAIPRLALPGYNWWNEGLHGLARDGYATVFPQAIGLAATWDPALLHAVGATVSTEARAHFNPAADSPRYAGLTVWSPNINIFRDPRWGRGQETYGEDPFLTATLGTQFIRGVQGDDAFYRRADATPKHFVAHSGPEQGRDSFDSRVSAHDLADTYLPAFHAALTDGHAAALMCSYNAINGTPSCADTALLTQKVRAQWGFPGYIVSDCDAVGNIADYQHFAADAAHGAAAALHAGVDLNCGHAYAALGPALAQGLVTEAEIDRALHRLLVAKAHLGILTPAECNPFPPAAATDGNELARRAAEESIVLLANKGTLPLAPTRSIAVIGPTADMLGVLEANYHGTALNPVTPLEGLEAAYPNLVYSQGSLLAEGVSAPVPRTALHVARDPGSAPGLRAEYFDHADVSGTPKLTTTVARVDMNLDRVGPSPQIAGGRYAARWSGYFTPPAPGDYVLDVKVERCWDCTTHDRFRLTLDDTAVLTNSGVEADPHRYTLHCADTRPHALKLELEHSGEDEGITLAWQPPASAQLAEAEQVARRADAIVIFAGLSPDLEGEALSVHLAGFAGGDRTSLALPATQKALIARMQGLGKPVVLVLTSGSAIALDAREQQAAAILEAWYPGEQGGTALAEILTGAANPSGRLPVTFYRSADDLPAFTDYSMAHRTYRYFTGPVLYPFGMGLSYTHFAYGPVRLSQSHVRAGQAPTATVTVRNDGARAGAEVVEVYVAPPAQPGSPHRSLAGTTRITLEPGESRQVQLGLLPAAFSTVDAAGDRTIEPGTYRVYVGGAQPTAASPAAKVTIIGREPLR